MGTSAAAGEMPAALERIEHMVVLMLENRSFDHMLGYLGLPEANFAGNVEGLQNARTTAPDGTPYEFREMDEELFLAARVDPPHDQSHVATQIAGGQMNGFVDALADSLRSKRRSPEAQDPRILNLVMEHMTARKVPIFDHLARNFCVCDHWYSSLPGPTLPNRVFAVAGTSDGVMSDNAIVLRKFGKFRSFFQFLRPEVTWRWYSSDPGILRLIDKNYMFDNSLDRFAYVDQCTDVQPRSFLRDLLEQPDLPAISWLDPNFNMKDILNFKWFPDGVGSDDDHPPAPVVMGQHLVHKIYQALGQSRYWDSCLLVVTYDEHGGFFDHVAPPPGLGVRVPTLLISPHIAPSVCSTPFHHASLIKTILHRFGAPDWFTHMPAAVSDAEDLSSALRTDAERTPFVQVANAGAAKLKPNDLTPTLMAEDASTLTRTVDFADRALTDLQKVIIYGVALPLRTGRKLMRLALFFRPLKHLASVERVHADERLLPRRP